MPLYAEEQGGGHDGPRPEFFEAQPIERDSVHVMTRQDQGTVFTQQVDVLDISGTAPLEADVQDKVQADMDDLLGRSTAAEIEYTSKDGVQADDMAPPRITRPIPPPPVNLRSKPTPPASPPLSPPPKTTLQALRVDEEECPSSPDIPPRPVPPPGRSGACQGAGCLGMLT